MGKRYRSTHKGLIMGDGRGGTIRFTHHRFPKWGDPPCEDRSLIAHIESVKGFGKTIFIEEGTGGDSLVQQQPDNPDTELQILERAAREMQRMGLHVNPAVLKETGVEPVEEKTPPTPGFVNTAKKSELISLIEEWGWNIDTNATNAVMREKILEAIG